MKYIVYYFETLFSDPFDYKKDERKTKEFATMKEATKFASERRMTVIKELD
jgi:hypothetical protein